MKKTISRVLITLIISGLLYRPAPADNIISPDKDSPSSNAVSSKNRCGQGEVSMYSNTIMVWRNKASGKWESKSLKEPRVKVVRANDLIPERSQRPAMKTKRDDMVSQM